MAIGAAVRAKRLRFRRGPKTNVTVHGEVDDSKLREAERRHGLDEEPVPRIEVDTDSGSRRDNLPDEVEPGVTYRDVRAGWMAAARIRRAEDDET